MRIRTIIMSAAMFLTAACTASAGVRHIQVLAGCRTTGFDPTLITVVTAPSKAACTRKMYGGGRSVIYDEWMGVRFELRPSSGTPLGHTVVSPQGYDIANDDRFDLCGRLHPGGRIYDVWFVPEGSGCNGRSEQSALYRRFLLGTDNQPTKIYLMPSGIEIGVGQLYPKAQERVRSALDVARRAAGLPGIARLAQWSD